MWECKEAKEIAAEVQREQIMSSLLNQSKGFTAQPEGNREPFKGFKKRGKAI